MAFLNNSNQLNVTGLMQNQTNIGPSLNTTNDNYRKLIRKTQQLDIINKFVTHINIENGLNSIINKIQDGSFSHLLDDIIDISSLQTPSIFISSGKSTDFYRNNFFPLFNFVDNNIELLLKLKDIQQEFHDNSSSISTGASLISLQTISIEFLQIFENSYNTYIQPILTDLSVDIIDLSAEINIFKNERTSLEEDLNNLTISYETLNGEFVVLDNSINIVNSILTPRSITISDLSNYMYNRDLSISILENSGQLLDYYEANYGPLP
tara:strand:+ start:5923 stop:6720 length:798 start_codon:yes stop_codon:yes gene_type:complete